MSGLFRTDYSVSSRVPPRYFKLREVTPKSIRRRKQRRVPYGRETKMAPVPFLFSMVSFVLLPPPFTSTPHSLPLAPIAWRPMDAVHPDPPAAKAVISELDNAPLLLDLSFFFYLALHLKIAREISRPSESTIEGQGHSSQFNLPFEKTKIIKNATPIRSFFFFLPR